MSRKILKQEYLPLILRYFSQNPQERNAKHFQASLVAVTFDRLTSTHIYRLFSKTAEQANIGRLLKAL
jgi:nitrate reductase assembly molybdenum cofactor insertion protein NarJ